MLAECSIAFTYSPATTAWSTSATLRVDASLLGYHNEEHDETPSLNLSPLSATKRIGDHVEELSQLQLLVYLSRFHQLKEVVLEEEEEEETTVVHDGEEAEGSASPEQAPLISEEQLALTTLAAAAASTVNVSSPSRDVNSNQGKRSVLQSFWWRPFRSAIHHTQLRDLDALSSSEHSPKSTEEGKEGVLPSESPFHQRASIPKALFSTLLSSMPSSIGLDQEEMNEEGDGFVLHFDSLSSASDAPGSVAQPHESQVAASPNAAPAVKAVAEEDAGDVSAAVEKAATRRLPLSLSLPPVASSTVPATANALNPVAADSRVAATSADAEAAAAPQRRLLLLRPGGPAAAPPAVSDEPPRGRVLNISAAAAMAPPSPFPPTDTAALPEVKPEKPQISRTTTVKAEPPASAETSPQGNEMWIPHILSFVYPPPPSPSCTVTATSAAAGGGDVDGCTQRPCLRRRLVAVHLTFRDATASTPRSMRDVELTTALQWTRASVAACGWFARRRQSQQSDASRAMHASGSGYALITGGASLDSCWMCPSIASIHEGPRILAETSVKTLNNDDATAPAPLKAGPLADVWVKTVSASVFSSSLLPVVKLEAIESEECGAKASTPRSSTAPVLPCLSFSPTWLSQLACTFGPPALLSTSSTDSEACGDEHAVETAVHERLPGAPAPSHAHAWWPSPRISGLSWASTQISADCVKLRSVPVVSPSLLSSPSTSSLSLPWSVTCVCLRSDVYLADALHAYAFHLHTRWAQEGSTQREPISLPSCFPDVAHASSTPKSLRILVTRAAPASLVLSGGAVGGACGIVVADETARAAELTVLTTEAEGTGTVSAVARLSPQALRARVAVAAAVLQCFLRSAMDAEQLTHDSVSDGEVQQRHARASSLPPDRSVDMREADVRCACVARAIALQWVCTAAYVIPAGWSSVQQLLEEERVILTSASGVGHLLEKEKKDDITGGAAHTSADAALQLLRPLQRRYSRASLASLVWWSHTVKALQWTFSHSALTADLIFEQRRLCRWAAEPFAAASNGRPATPPLLPSSLAHAFLSATAAESREHASYARLSTVAELLKGSVDVQIQHLPTLNALQLQLEWRTKQAVTTSSETATAPELPFFLFVFVVDENTEESERQQDAHAAARGGAVRLYQVTPFTWSIPHSCTTAVGSTANLSLTVMHAADLVARRPDVFKDFSLHAVTGVSQTAKQQQQPRKGPGKRSRTASRAVANTTTTGDVKTEALWASGGKQSKKRSRAPARRRRRTAQGEEREESSSSSSSDESDAADSAEASQPSSSPKDSEGVADDGDTNFAAALAEDGGEQGDDGDTLFLNLGRNSTARKSKKASPASARFGEAKLYGAGTASALDTARVIPLVVYRRDAAAPLLDVEVRYADLLRAQLAAAGYTTSAYGTSAISATSALCRLVTHLTGFTTAHAAAADKIAQLQVRQEYASNLCTFSTAGSRAEAHALTKTGVLCAYAELLRGVLDSLTSTVEASAALRAVVDVDTVLSHALDAECVVAAVRSAMDEYARQDAVCRACMLSHDLEARFERLSAVVHSAGGGTATKRSTVEVKQRQRQLLELTKCNTNAIAAEWGTPSGDGEEKERERLLAAFYNSVLTTRLSARCRAWSSEEIRGQTSFAETNLWTRRGLATSLSADASAYASLVSTLLPNALPPQRRSEARLAVPSSAPAAASPAAPSSSAPFRLQLVATPAAARNAPSSRMPPSMSRAAASGAVPFRGDVLSFCPSSEQPQLLSRRRLEELCATHLHSPASSSCSSPAKGDTAFSLLAASAQALLTNSSVAPVTQEKTAAAASLGLVVAQLAHTAAGEER